MSTILHKFSTLTLSVLALFAVVSCDGDKKDPVNPEEPEVVKPTLSSVEIENASLTQTDATIAVKFSDATTIYYTCVEGTDAEFDTTTFESVNVKKDDKSLSIDLSELTAATDYSVGVYASNAKGDTDVKSIKFTTLEEEVVTPTVALSYDAEKRQLATKTTDAAKLFYTIYAKDKRPEEVEWTEYIINDGVDFTLDIDYLTWGEFVMEAYASSAEEVECVIESLSYEVAKPEVDSYFEITNVEVTPADIIATFDIDEKYCEAVAFTATPVADFSKEAFVEAIEMGYIDVLIKNDKDVIYNNGFRLDPNTEYTIAAVAVRVVSESVDAWEQTVYQYETLGDMIVENHTTDTYKIGDTDASVTLTINEETITTNSITVNIAAGENTKSYMYSHVETSEIPNGDVAAWIESTNWLNSPETATIDFKDMESHDNAVYGLESGVEYTIFAVGLAESGYVGELSYASATTKEVILGGDIEYTVEVSAGRDESTIDVTFVSNCVKVYYMHMPVGPYTTAADAEEMLLYNISGGYDSASLRPENGTASLISTNLKADTEYVFFSIGVDENGGVSKISDVRYKTRPVTYTSSASVVLTEEKSSINSENGNATITLAVEMTGGAEQYLYVVMDDYIENKNDMAAYGAAALNAFGKKTTKAPKVDITLYNSTYIAIFIPIDENGEYGTPVKYVYNGWNN